jgi:hypothetical protein
MYADAPIHFGLLRSFGEPTLLFIGDARELKKLQEHLSTLAHSLTSSCLKWKSPNGDWLLTGQMTAESVQATGLSVIGNAMEWLFSKDQSEAYAALIEAVIESDGPSHCYLDSYGPSKFQIMVSKGEYTPNVFLDD